MIIKFLIILNSISNILLSFPVFPLQKMIRRSIRLFSSSKNNQELFTTPHNVFLEKYGRTIAWGISLSSAAFMLWLIDKRSGGRYRKGHNDSSLNPQVSLNPTITNEKSK